jgi:hypothetical protein
LVRIVTIEFLIRYHPSPTFTAKSLY